MRRTGKAENVIAEMKRHEINVLGLSETKWSGNGDYMTEDGYRIIHYGGRKHQQGVTIILNKWTATKMKTVVQKNDRLILVKIEAELRDIEYDEDNDSANFVKGYQPIRLILGLTEIEQINALKYLAVNITADGRCRNEIEVRIAMAKKTSTTKRELFTNGSSMDTEDHQELDMVHLGIWIRIVGIEKRDID